MPNKTASPSLLIDEIAERVIAHTIAAEGTLLVKSPETGGREYWPLDVGAGLTITIDTITETGSMTIDTLTVGGLSHPQVMSRIFLG